MNNGTSPFALPLVILLAAGWPLLFFVHYHWRKHRSVPASFLGLILPTIGVFFVAGSISDIAFVLARRGGALFEAASWLLFAVAWGLPYVLLILWTMQTLRAGNGKIS
jgi:hypothetical protein